DLRGDETHDAIDEVVREERTEKLSAALDEDVLEAPPPERVEQRRRIDAARLGRDTHDADALVAERLHALLGSLLGRDDEHRRLARRAHELRLERDPELRVDDDARRIAARSVAAREERVVADHRVDADDDGAHFTAETVRASARFVARDPLRV